MVDVVYSESFQKSVKKIKNSDLKDNIRMHIAKIVNFPDIGKPLRYDFRNERTVYVKPYRIIYSYRNNVVTFLIFEHRDSVYE